MAAPRGTGIMKTIRCALEPAVDPTLVDNTARLLDTLNKSDRLAKLLCRKDERGYTLLHLAAERNQPESLKCLLIKNADPNVRSSPSSNEVTPLHVAAECGNLACLQLLVLSGGEVTAKDSLMRTPSSCASVSGQRLCCSYLSEVLEKRESEERRDIENILTEVESKLAGNSLTSLTHWDPLNEVFPLSLASEAQNVSQVENVLHRHCVLINSRDLCRVFGCLSSSFVPTALHDASLLHAACRFGRVKLARLLIERFPQSLHGLTNEGYNMLHVAVASEELELVRLLIQAQVIGYQQCYSAAASPEGTGGGAGGGGGGMEEGGGGVEAPGTRERTCSASSQNANGGSGGVPVNLGARTLSGHTALHFAAALNSTQVLSELLKYQRELKLSVDGSECGYTALHLAVHLRHPQCAEVLLRKGGANPNLRQDASMCEQLCLPRTPLATAVVNGDPHTLRLLLEHGAEDCHHDALKACLADSSCCYGSLEMVPLLLGSLIKTDEVGGGGGRGGGGGGGGPRGPAGGGRKDHGRPRVKTGAVDWSGLQLKTLDPAWLQDAFAAAMFFRLQGISNAKALGFVTSVTLGHNRLSSLPPELFQLPRLSVLNLSNNRLVDLPPLERCYCESTCSYEWPCRGLTKVTLSRNCLVSVPEYLFELPLLSSLDLSHNSIKHLPLAMWSAPKLYLLNCSHNQLEAVPSNWPTLELRVVRPPTPVTPQGKSRGGNSSNKQPNPTASPRFSSTLDPSQQPHPPAMSSSGGGGGGGGGDDRDLLLGGGGGGTEERKSGTDEVTPISKLQDRMNICNANLHIEWESDASSEEVYEGLSILNLSNNFIAEIPDNFPCLCPKLTRLDLSHNQLSSVSLPRSFPPSVKQINLSFNLFTSINSEQLSCKPLPCTNPQVLSESGSDALTHDGLSYCQHRQHNHLMGLSVLEVNNCQLSSVNLYSPLRTMQPNKVKFQENELPYLAASSMPNFSRTNRSLHTLAQLVCPLLTRLVLSGNRLTKVPESICDMVSLNSLDLSYNSIIELPSSLGKLGNLWEFPLAGLKLISPPHNIIERGKTKDIIGFLWSLLQRARPYHRMKLMLVGKAARGKTTLLEKISDKGQRGLQENWALTRMLGREGKGREKLSTVGIVVSDWTYYKKVKESHTSLKSITFMTWDFGGQEEYYATHQCFLSCRSLYLVVWNVTHGMKGADELKPWLLSIQARAPHSPVIIVGTHRDKLKSSEQRGEVRAALQHILSSYGSRDERKEGYPHVLESVTVSCQGSGRGINDLRKTIFDVASQVKENTVSGRGIGCGKIPEYRLLMDQLVPASYLQLEDTIRNIALNMRARGRPPVLNYRELRELVFADPSTLISKSSADRELEQAVRFLHDNGTMLHYEDPMLNNLYFVDPQWLCDMLAHIVTVREINPFIKDGIMKISNFPLIFNDNEFPIAWKKEYIRLLTTFEVAVELLDDQLLVPSTLPSDRPNLPQTVYPQELKVLPDLHHMYIVPFVPSGLWPRLMCRILTDPTILQLAKEGCRVRSKDEEEQLSWVKWKQGIILQYGNLTVFSMEELNRDIFEGDYSGIMIQNSKESWRRHSRTVKIFGIEIRVPDIFPILKYPEAAGRRRRRGRREGGEGGGEGEAGAGGDGGDGGGRRGLLRKREGERVGAASHRSSSPLPPSTLNGHLAPPPPPPPPLDPRGALLGRDDPTASQRLGMDEIDAEFEKLKKRRGRNFTRGGVDLEPSPAPHGRTSRAGSRQQEGGGGGGGGEETVDEECYDRMRAGLLSKMVEHVTILVEEWFTGVRPRHLVVPCPHCSQGKPPGDVPFSRSFSANPHLDPNLASVPTATPTTTTTAAQPTTLTPPLSSQRQAEPSPKAAQASSLTTETTTSSSANEAARGGIGSRVVEGVQRLLGLGAGEAHRDTRGDAGRAPRLNRYVFQYSECVVQARERDEMHCELHGPVPLQYLAPDTLFLAQGRDMLVGQDDIVREETIGQGGFATVYRARIRNKQRDPEVSVEEQYRLVALKALTKEWTYRDQQSSSRGREGEGPQGNLGGGARPLSRHSIVEGFNNLRKELSVLAPLKHQCIVELYGVLLRPLGLVMELAPRGCLKDILKGYSEAQVHLQCNVQQATIKQVAMALEYLHSRCIIYRDMKSDNVLVWSFPEPQEPVPLAVQLDSNYVLVKLSDYGISQFATTQGAQGLVGTPGFMAPEILKYHGREAYTHKVDLFSFGMFIYELVTLHIPYQNLSAQQANQAIENGARPSLTRKDLPCPPLLRELMVWCWQQHPEDRPEATEVLSVVQTQQFLRLVDGIRVCDGAKVMAVCARTVASSFVSQALSTSGAFTRSTGSRKHLSPTSPLLLNHPASSTSDRPAGSQPAPMEPYSNPHKQVLHVLREVELPMPTNGGPHPSSVSTDRSRTLPPETLCSQDHTLNNTVSRANTVALSDNQLVLPARQSSLTGETTEDHAPSLPRRHSNSSGGNSNKSNRFSKPDGSTCSSAAGRSQKELAVVSPWQEDPGGGGRGWATSPHHHHHHHHNERGSPSMDGGSRSSSSQPGYYEEESYSELWVVSCEGHHSVATVLCYSGRFLSIEDIDLGDAPATAVCTVGGGGGGGGERVWVGFEDGHLLVLDATSRRLLAQAWLQHFSSINCILHIQALKRVYVALGNGSVLAYDDDLGMSGAAASAAAAGSSRHSALTLAPVAEYHDSLQTSMCLLAVPPSPSPSSPSPSPSPAPYEVWVGQRNCVVVLCAGDLSVVEIIENRTDSSTLPSYVAYLAFTNLVCSDDRGCAPFGEDSAMLSLRIGEGGGSGVGRGALGRNVFGALYHGQCVTRWSAEDKRCLQTFNLEEQEARCHITCLHYSNLQLCVGLTSGKVIILSALSFELLCVVASHRNHVKTLITIETGGELGAGFYSRERSGSIPSAAGSQTGNPSPLHRQEVMMAKAQSRRESSAGSVPPSLACRQLLSFGEGFRSYFDGPESQEFVESGFCLVWDPEHWNVP